MAVAGSIEWSSQRHSFWIHLKRFGKGPNAVGTIIFLEVMRLKATGSKADVLVIQMDNAIGENKNRYVFGVAALLVLWGWFARVEIHMLVRGHTHDVQDSAFGVLHKKFRATGVLL